MYHNSHIIFHQDLILIDKYLAELLLLNSNSTDHNLLIVQSFKISKRFFQYISLNINFESLL
ncbi:MAG: hypothetical protein Q8S84_04120 [bacterium]|nr:hypothetical protein [bacterium]